MSLVFLVVSLAISLLLAPLCYQVQEYPDPVGTARFEGNSPSHSALSLASVTQGGPRAEGEVGSRSQVEEAMPGEANFLSEGPGAPPSGLVSYRPAYTTTLEEKSFLPLIWRAPVTLAATEWTQHAHDAQRSSFTAQVVPTPWRWKWAWNGPNATGEIVSGKFRLPRNSQPVTGGGRVYIAAGSRGVYALNNMNGTVIWARNPGGNINSTPAYDRYGRAVRPVQQRHAVQAQRGQRSYPGPVCHRLGQRPAFAASLVWGAGLYLHGQPRLCH